MKKPPHSQRPAHASLRIAAIGIVVLGIASRAIGLVREMIVASTFGAGAELDAIYLGLSVPIAVALGLGGGASRAIVRAGAVLNESQLGGLFRLASRRLLLLAAPIAMGLLVLSPLWVKLLIPAGSQASYGLVLAAAAGGCLAIAGGSLAGLAMGLANSRGRHVSSSVTPLVHNLVIIGAVVLLSPVIGALSLMVGIVAAEWLQIATMGGFLGRIARRARAVDDSVLAPAEAVFWPAVVLSMFASLNGTVDRYFAAGLGGGAVSALAYAEKLFFLPVLLLGLALQQPLYTRLAQFAADRRRRAFEQTVELGLRLALLFGVPATVLIVAFAEPLIGVLLERGQFSLEDTRTSAVALRGYAVAMVFQSLMPLLVSAGLAKGRAWSLVALAAGGLVLNAWLNAQFAPRWGLFGIALATSCVSLAMAAAMLTLNTHRLWLRGAIWLSLGRGLLIAALGAVPAWAIHYWIPAPTGFTARCVYLALGGIAVAAAMGLPMARVLLAEWWRLRTLNQSSLKADT